VTEDAVHVWFSPCGRWLAGGFQDHYRLWRGGAGEGGRGGEGDGSWLAGRVGFAPRRAPSAPCDSPPPGPPARAADSSELARLEAPREAGGVTALAFSPGGERLAVARGAGVALWDLRQLRRELAACKLDWDAPRRPPPKLEGGRLQVRVEMG